MTEFVKVKRLMHGDTMSIVKEVADKYPERFEVIKPKRKRKMRTKVVKVEDSE